MGSRIVKVDFEILKYRENGIMGLPRSAESLGRRLSSLDFWGYIERVPSTSLMGSERHGSSFSKI